MNIGSFFISPTGQMFHGLELVGSVVKFDFQCSGSARRGHLSLRPCESSMEQEAIAFHMAADGISISIDVYGEFWPSSFKRDGEWYFESSPGVIKSLGLSVHTETAEEDPFDAGLTGVY